jgi:hypothetical protein
LGKHKIPKGLTTLGEGSEVRPEPEVWLRQLRERAKKFLSGRAQRGQAQRSPLSRGADSPNFDLRNRFSICEFSKVLIQLTFPPTILKILRLTSLPTCFNFEL